MLFELLFARKYVAAKKGRLSIALISWLSVFVIALVVWLSLLFLSVTEGLEKTWVGKLTTFHGPIQLTPTDKYFSSYYYNIDALSSRSDFTLKSIHQKKLSLVSDPFSPDIDASLPSSFPEYDNHDPVKEACAVLEKMPGVYHNDFALGGAMLRLSLLREMSGGHIEKGNLTQISFLASFQEDNPYLASLVDESASFDQINGHPVVIPSTYKESGVKLGDAGFLAYGAQTMSSLSEMRLPIYVSGFYDPGIMSIGAKCLLVPPEVIENINSVTRSFALDKSQSSGIKVWTEHLRDVPKLKKQIVQALEDEGIADYWSVSSYLEYPFAKDLMQQFQSDKYLFTLIAVIILLVACSNVVSFLLLLVNDKKKEIGILQAMGASRFSIGVVFALSGAIIGTFSTLLGTLAAYLTLHNIDSVVSFLSFLQGHDAFNASFYGDQLPSRLSDTAVYFTLIATPILATCAGLIPALRASKLKTSEILKA